LEESVDGVPVVQVQHQFAAGQARGRDLGNWQGSMSRFPAAVKHIPVGQNSGAAAYLQNVQIRAALYKVACCAMIFALFFSCSDVFSETPDSTLEVAETALAKLDATNLDDDWYFSMEKSRDQVRGALLLNTKTQQIEEIEINNTGKLSPAFSVTVDTYRLVLKFQQEQGENLLKKLESHAVGHAGFLKSFDVFMAVTFSDYKRAER